MCTSRVSQNRRRTIPCKNIIFVSNGAEQDIMKGRKKEIYIIWSSGNTLGLEPTPVHVDCGGNSGKGGSFSFRILNLPLLTYFSQCPTLTFIFKVTPDLTKRARSGGLPTEAAREKSTVDHAYNVTKTACVVINGRCSYGGILLWLRVRNYLVPQNS